jgi:valyl-tRNA synthetase
MDAEDSAGVLTLDSAALVLGEVRKRKSEAKRPLNARVERVIVADAQERLNALSLAERDVRAAGVIEVLELRPGVSFEIIEIHLADPISGSEPTPAA